MEEAFLVYLYSEQDWPSLVAASRRALFEGESEIAEITLAAAYARVEPARAETLLQGFASGPQRSWALLQLADARRDDPWQALAWLDAHAREFPEQATDWRCGARARMRLSVGDLDGAAALAPAVEVEGHRRSPVAGALASALLPGLGQAISGQPLEAASALLVVSSLAAGTAWAAEKDRAPTALAIGILGGLFWSGNVYGGADAAIRANRARVEDQIHQLDALGLPGGDPPPLPFGEQELLNDVFKGCSEAR